MRRLSWLSLLGLLTFAAVAQEIVPAEPLNSLNQMPRPRGEGTQRIRVEMIIHANGRLEVTSVKPGSDPQLAGWLEKRWKWKPATRDGQPVTTRRSLDLEISP